VRAHLVADSGCLVGEAPLWVSRLARLLWTDLLQPHVHVLDETSGTWQTLRSETPIMALGETDDGGLVVATATRIDLLAARLEPQAALGPPDVRFNDGACGPDGRFWVGTKSTTGAPGQGHLLRIELGHADIMLSGVSVANGLGWSPDDATMYFTDSAAGEVHAFAFHQESGRISEQRSFVLIDEGIGRPDGLAVDVDGGVWIALWGGSRIQRFDETGRLSEEVFLPVPYVTSCAFGGQSLDKLYVTTASTMAFPIDVSQGAGGLFVVEPGISGRPVGHYVEDRRTRNSPRDPTVSLSRPVEAQDERKGTSHEAASSFQIWWDRHRHVGL